MKIFQAWTMGSNTEELTELKCKSKKEFIKRLKKQGRALTSKIVYWDEKKENQ